MDMQLERLSACFVPTEGPKRAGQKYEDVDLEFGGVNVMLNSGLKRAVPEVPPPRKIVMEDHTVVYPEQNDGSCSDPYYKPEDRAGQESGGLEKANQKYEDVDLEFGGVNVMLNSGLKRAVPELPPPRKIVMEDHTVVYPEQNDGSCSDPYYKPEDRADQESGEGLEKAGKKYEDVDLEFGGVNVMLNSGLKRAVPELPPPRKIVMEDHTVVYPEQNDESCSDPYYKPEDRAGQESGGMSTFNENSHTVYAFEHSSTCDQGPEKANQKYEDVDLEFGGVNVMLNSGLKRAVPEVPPPRKIVMEDHTVVYPEQNDGSYSDPYYKQKDRAGQESGEGLEKAGKKYEDVDLEFGGVNVMLNSGLKRAVPDVPPPRKIVMEDHTVVYPAQIDESCSDPYYKPEDRAGQETGEA
ncbi:uncharacterized protein LOC144869910 [Branchiostoma floridae x Branchiostoma japonicum]